MLDQITLERCPTRALEAGCGSMSHLNLRGVHVTGIDISQHQLDRNPGLDTVILGDLQTYPLASQAFDLVVCWDVLEHLPEPGRALENMAQALRPAGLLVVKIPNLFSLKGLLTKFTPHAFHVWFYRHIRRMESAGRQDTAPFRTYFTAAISATGLRRFAQSAGLEVAYLTPFERNWTGNWRIAVVNALVRAVAWPVRVLTFNAVRLADSQLIAIYRRPTCPQPCRHGAPTDGCGRPPVCHLCPPPCGDGTTP
jgi:SAM-dependent methyltransferase